MRSELEQRFFAEVDDGVRSRMLGELERRRDGRAEFTFNLFEVQMDFDARTVTLAGTLVSEGEVVWSLADFKTRLEVR